MIAQNPPLAGAALPKLAWLTASNLCDALERREPVLDDHSRVTEEFTKVTLGLSGAWFPISPSATLLASPSATHAVRTLPDHAT